MEKRLPNPASERDTMSYLESQAAAGHFNGPGSTLAILMFLARNSWRRTPNQENAGIGTVLKGYSRYDRIAAGTAFSYRTVERAMVWLKENRWLEVEFERDQKGHLGQYRIFLLLDSSGHRERAKYQEMHAEMEALVAKMADGA